MKEKVQKVILIGGTGLLARGLLATLPGNIEIAPTFCDNAPPKSKYSFEHLDITDKSEMGSLFLKIRPDVVIHTASIGNVDFCEKNPEKANQVNVFGTENVVAVCREYKSKLIFTSTNAVFDGTNAPYSETSETNPINHYGTTKVKGENMVLDADKNNTVVRLTLIYGWNNPNQRLNAVTWLLDRLRRVEATNLVNDTYVNPIYYIQAAENIWRILELNKKGIFHLAGKDRVNRYQFGVAVAKGFGFDERLLNPVASDYFPGIARRMPDTTFDTSKMVKELNSHPLSIQEGLEHMKLNVL